MEIRSAASGPNDVRVELQFKSTGNLKSYKRVDLRIDGEHKPLLSATLKETYLEDGSIVVSCLAARTQLGNVKLWVMCADGIQQKRIYEIRLNEFVRLAQDNSATPRGSARAQRPR
jgi:hypothetical protein